MKMPLSHKICDRKNVVCRTQGSIRNVDHDAAGVGLRAALQKSTSLSSNNS